MPAKRAERTEHIQYHNGGTVWARGQTIDGVPTGYCEWFRKDSTKLRSGHFEAGEQVGEWTIYDATRAVYKGAGDEAQEEVGRLEAPARGDRILTLPDRAQDRNPVPTKEVRRRRDY